ncbi:uncharacterized protein LOC111263046 [Varroa jacobsoni]|uniref:uncharacterized protein LOC111263046 n=1 Tax=Varroa jacobsoni TaxID=62625 RepID=UPI000BFAADBF|nr:uncharacterized protein LOC111263046 [Varroa jacobsoni]
MANKMKSGDEKQDNTNAEIASEMKGVFTRWYRGFNLFVHWSDATGQPVSTAHLGKTVAGSFSRHAKARIVTYNYHHFFRLWNSTPRICYRYLRCGWNKHIVNPRTPRSTFFMKFIIEQKYNSI